MYDPRYLAGIVLFNRHDFFEAHDVWEELWADADSPERRFYQGLIQAAVALLHFSNGNIRGAAKLFRSSRDYMAPYGAHYLGFDIGGFWRQMGHCFAELHAQPGLPVELRPERIPEISLDPPPPSWPDAEPFLRDADR